MISDYYFKEVDGKTIESRFRYSNQSMLVFFEWLDGLKELDKQPFIKFMFNLFRIVIRKIIYKPDYNASSIIVTSTDIESYYDIKDKSIKEGSMFAPISNYLHDFSIVDIPYDHNILRAHKDSVVLESYFPLKKLWFVIKQRKKMKKEWQNLKRYIPEELHGKGDTYFRYYLFRDLFDITCYDTLFKTKKPLVYVTFSSFSPQGLRAIIAAKYNSVKTIGIQTGIHVIGHTERSKSENAVKIFPFIDLFLAWGVNQKERLVQESKISKEKVRVIGSTRLDVLHYRKTNYEKGKHSILITTQNIKYSDILPYIVVDAVNPVTVYIKKHKGDKRDYINLNVKEVTDLHSCLGVVDVMVTISSTTLMEANILGKPYIIFNPDRLDPDFTEKEYWARDKSELAILLNKVMYDKKYSDEILEKQRALFEKHYHKQDGLASKRAAEIINENIIDKSTN